MVRGRRKRPSTRIAPLRSAGHLCGQEIQRAVAPTANKKVFVRAASQSDLEGLYAINCSLLDAALAHTHSRLQKCQSLNVDAMQAAKLATDDSSSVRERVAKLFELVAMLSSIDELLHLVRNMNDRLRRARVAEVKVLPGVIDELTVLCDLYAKGDTESLRAALKTYHDRRQKSVLAIHHRLVLVSL
jgi:DNA-binding GntR family transcriptional regulator